MDVNVKNVRLDEKQQAAVDLCLKVTSRLVGVSGPAGSGKTTIIRMVHEHFAARGKLVVLAAPTGKAARRIKEATGIDAITLHKLLEYNRPGARDEKTGEPLDPTMPKRRPGNPLAQDVIIIDEYAMVNYELHNNLLAAMRGGSIVRMFGDINQLAPIEQHKLKTVDNKPMPSPFEKILSGFPNAILDKVYRQGDGSQVLLAADGIRKGHAPPLNRDCAGEFFAAVTDKPLDVLRKHVETSLSHGVSYRDIKNQIITTQKTTWVGTAALNGFLRNILNPHPEQQLSLERHKWDKNPCVVGLGDKVVCTQNTYDMRNYFERFEDWKDDLTPKMESFIPCPPTKQMLNGETGTILFIYPDGGLEIDFGDRICEVPAYYEELWAKEQRVIRVSPLRDIDLAYALTTHKCQGSEFEQVCYVMNKSTMFTQSRRNFYTGVTRAAKRAFVITDQRSLRASLWKVI